MTFPYDTTGVKETGDFSPVPEGTYLLRIGGKELKKTQAGDPMVSVALTVEDGEYSGRKMWTNIVFKKKDEPGAGMAKHWLHAIGQPYEGKIQVDPEGWTGVIKADVKIETYKDKDRNTVSFVHLPEEESAPAAEETAAPPIKEKSSDEVPF